MSHIVLIVSCVIWFDKSFVMLYRMIASWQGCIWVRTNFCGMLFLSRCSVLGKAFAQLQYDRNIFLFCVRMLFTTKETPFLSHNRLIMDKSRHRIIEWNILQINRFNISLLIKLVPKYRQLEVELLNYFLRTLYFLWHNGILFIRNLWVKIWSKEILRENSDFEEGLMLKWQGPPQLFDPQNNISFKDL